MLDWRLTCWLYGYVKVRSNNNQEASMFNVTPKFHLDHNIFFAISWCALQLDLGSSDGISVYDVTRLQSIFNKHFTTIINSKVLFAAIVRLPSSASFVLSVTERLVSLIFEIAGVSTGAGKIYGQFFYVHSRSFNIFTSWKIYCASWSARTFPMTSVFVTLLLRIVYVARWA